MFDTDNLSRTLFLSGNVTSENTKSLIENIFKLMGENEIKPIRLVIQSGGGSFSSALAFYDIVRSAVSPLPLVTYGVGDVHSAAVVFFLAAKTRITTSHASFILHPGKVSYERPVSFNLNELETLAKDLRTSTEFYASIVAANSGKRMSARTVRGMMDAGRVLSPQEAIKYGIATELLTVE